MAISKHDVKIIATLAHLEVHEPALTHYAQELSNIMEVIHELQKTDTDLTEPMSHPQDIELRLRADQITEPNQREELQAIAPQVVDGLYLVPKVLE